MGRPLELRRGWRNALIISGVSSLLALGVMYGSPSATTLVLFVVPALGFLTSIVGYARLRWLTRRVAPLEAGAGVKSGFLSRWWSYLSSL